MKPSQVAILSSGWIVAIFLAGYIWALSSASVAPVSTTAAIESVSQDTSLGDIEAQPASSKGSINESKTRAAQGFLAFGTGYDSFPVSIFDGRSPPLRLTASQRTFVTRLREAYQYPANFGGSMVLAQFGCGTGCTFAYALDRSSGLVLEFPVGGEDYQALQMHGRVDSALIWASWYASPAWDSCKGQAWLLGPTGFTDMTGEVEIDCDTKTEIPSL